MQGHKAAALLLYQYLELLNEPSEEKNAGLARYIRKLLSETRRTDGQLFHLLVKTDRTCLQNPLELYEQMRSMFGHGCRSPFLYGEACRLLNMYPDLFVKMGDFEVQLLLSGLKNNWLSKEISLMAAVFFDQCKILSQIIRAPDSRFILRLTLERRYWKLCAVF